MRPDFDFVPPGPLRLLKGQPIGSSCIAGFGQIRRIADDVIDISHDGHVEIAIEPDVPDVKSIFGTFPRSETAPDGRIFNRVKRTRGGTPEGSRCAEEKDRAVPACPCPMQQNSQLSGHGDDCAATAFGADQVHTPGLNL